MVTAQNSADTIKPGANGLMPATVAGASKVVKMQTEPGASNYRIELRVCPVPAIRTYSVARLVISCPQQMLRRNYFALSLAFLWSLLSMLSFNLRSASAAGWYSLTQLSVLPAGDHAVTLLPLITAARTGILMWLHVCSGVAMV